VLLGTAHIPVAEGGYQRVLTLTAQGVGCLALWQTNWVLGVLQVHIIIIINIKIIELTPVRVLASGSGELQ
jgi:hypothetical protein